MFKAIKEQYQLHTSFFSKSEVFTMYASAVLIFIIQSFVMGLAIKLFIGGSLLRIIGCLVFIYTVGTAVNYFSQRVVYKLILKSYNHKDED